MEKTIKFKNLSGWLKAAAIASWIYLIGSIICGLLYTIFMLVILAAW